MEITENKALGIKKIVAHVLETDNITITLVIFSDNTATIEQNALQYLPKIKDFYSEMDKKAVKFNGVLRHKISRYLNGELSVAAYKVSEILDKIELLFPSFNN